MGDEGPGWRRMRTFLAIYECRRGRLCRIPEQAPLTSTVAPAGRAIKAASRPSFVSLDNAAADVERRGSGGKHRVMTIALIDRIEMTEREMPSLDDLFERLERMPVPEG